MLFAIFDYVFGREVKRFRAKKQAFGIKNYEQTEKTLSAH
jgi:hypothetical protein